MQLRPHPPIPASSYNAGDKVETELEEAEADIKFNIHQFTPRVRPDKSKVIIFPAFSEFGCETLIPLYSIPELMRRKYQGYYSIVMGWYGREYLYKHLVDEFWEIKKEYQYLREYCRAIHHVSKNLKHVEKKAEEFGKVSTAVEISTVLLHPKMTTCMVKREQKQCPGRITTFQDFQQCQKCGHSYDPPGFFVNCNAGKKRAKWLPTPCEEKMEIARSLLPPNAVGVTARGRKCYGRNLTPEFYERLIWLLEDMGYNPVWLGEKQTTQPCPCDRIVDLRGNKEVRDFEQTLACVSQMKFTIQFWTASSRLAGAVGTPFIIFESPDQIYGNGQEGLRLHLTSKGPKKLVLAHFRSVLENGTKAIKIAESAIRSIERKDYSTMFGVVEDVDAVRALIRQRRNHMFQINWF